MAPQPEEQVCDPSAGTCGFLVATDDYLRKHYPKAFHKKKFRQHYNSDMFTGIEFDASMLRIGAMNMMLHGIEQPNLIGVDALSEANGNIKDRFSLILANPPFKGSLDYDACCSVAARHTKRSGKRLLKTSNCRR